MNSLGIKLLPKEVAEECFLGFLTIRISRNANYGQGGKDQPCHISLNPKDSIEEIEIEQQVDRPDAEIQEEVDSFVPGQSTLSIFTIFKVPA